MKHTTITSIFNRKLILLSLCLALVTATIAEVRMTIEPELISLLDRAVLTIELIDTPSEDIEIPKIDGLDIQYLGPRTEVRFDGRNQSSKTSHRYIITPTKVGEFSVGPFNIKFSNGEETLSRKLKVIKPKDDEGVQQLSDLVFAKVSASRKAPLVQEPFKLKIKIYVRDDIEIDGRFSFRGGIPENGIDGELQWEVIGGIRKEIGGNIFKIYTLQAEVKTLTAGTFTFKPEVQINQIIPRQNRRSYGSQDPFFGDFFRRQEVRPTVLSCNRLDVKVQPLPIENRPESYTGGVGIFDFDVKVSPTKVKAGEPITIKMKISGEGNINKIMSPKIKETQNLKLYEARTIPTKNSNEIIFEQVIIPKSEHVTEIPAIEFSYFNSQTSSYETLKKGPFNIDVETAPQQTAQLVSSSQNTLHKKTKILGHDIVYQKSAPKKWRTHQYVIWHETRLFHYLLALPSLLLISIATITTKRNRLANDVALARRQKAPKIARQNIQQAEKALQEDDEATFNEAMWNALTNYFAHRLNLAPGEITLSTILHYIPQQAETIEVLFNTIEQRRYGITRENDSKKEMKNLLNQLTQTLKQCERIKL